ncbi:MAG: hypothetical protein ACRC6V_06590 [Bacteroidales bacterium]
MILGFVVVLMNFLAICTVIAGGLSLLSSQGWEVSLGFGVFGILFYNVGAYFQSKS